MNTLPALPGRLLLAGLICLGLGAMCFLAFLTTATRDAFRTRHQPRQEHPMHPHTPREAIAAALDDWWINTDPAETFHTLAVAEHISDSLTAFGYTVRPTPNHRPRARHITFGILTGLTTLATIQAAQHGHWWWITSAALAIPAATLAALVIRRDRRGDATQTYDG